MSDDHDDAGNDAERDADDHDADRDEHGADGGERDSGGLPAGSDPLIVNPIMSTGETGAIERPGDDRPAWVVGIFFIGFCALISGLVTVALTRENGNDTAAPVPTAPDVELVDPADAADPAGSEQPNAAPDAGTTPTFDEDEPSPTTVAAPVDDDRLPELGFARIDGDAFPIDAGCATHLPLAPNDATAQVSSYLFRTADGVHEVIDRRFGDRDGIGAELASGGEFVAVDDVGDGGAFVATFQATDGATTTVAVNPGLDHTADCSDTLVTNEPGQLAFPYTRIVMFVCVDGAQDTAESTVGVTSEGGRFSTRSNDDDTVTLTYRVSEFATDLVDTTASSFESDGRLGFSGVVTDGEASLDITVDFAAERVESCTASDLL